MELRRRLLLVSLLAFVFGAVTVSRAQNRWEAEIKKFEDADARLAPQKGAVLFAGSSSIRRWESLEKDFPKLKVINRGFGGSQIEDSTYYADRIIAPCLPRMVVLYAGDNDLAAGKSPEQVFADYKAFVARLRLTLKDITIAFISIKPSLARWQLTDKIKAANELIRNFSANDKRLAFIDIFPSMLGADGKPRPELYVSDGLHMTPQGYALWTSIVAKYLK